MWREAHAFQTQNESIIERATVWAAKKRYVCVWFSKVILCNGSCCADILPNTCRLIVFTVPWCSMTVLSFFHHTNTSPFSHTVNFSVSLFFGFSRFFVFHSSYFVCLSLTLSFSHTHMHFTCKNFARYFSSHCHFSFPSTRALRFSFLSHVLNCQPFDSFVFSNHLFLFLLFKTHFPLHTYTRSKT